MGEAAVVTCPGKHWNLLHSPRFQNFPNSGCREGAQPGDPFVPPTPAPWSPQGSTKPRASAVQTAAGLFSADRWQLYSMSVPAAFRGASQSVALHWREVRSSSSFSSS